MRHSSGGNRHRRRPEGASDLPYGDMVPGNYLAKVGLAPFVVSVSLALSVRNRLAAALAAFVLGTFYFSVLTGERINLLIRVCSGAWRCSPGVRGRSGWSW